MTSVSHSEPLPQVVPRVSVVCACYNRADYIRDTIDSLLTQDLHSFEVVVVNDGSDDPRVRDVLDSYNDPRLRVIHQQNTGFTRAICRAIESSSAPIIAIQGAGDVSHPERLRRQLEFLESNQDLIGVGCSIRHVVVGGRYSGFEEIRRPKSPVAVHDDIIKNNPFTHGEVMFRRVVYDKVGGYRPFFKYAQDRDLWLRMSLHGSFGFCPEVLYDRRSFSDGGVSSSHKKGLSQRKMSYIAIECVRERREFGFDIVDIYGAEAGLFRKRTREAARMAAVTALKYLSVDMHSEASFYSEMAIRERVTLITIGTRLIVLAPWRKVVKKILCQAIEMRVVKDTRNLFSILDDE